MRISFIGSGNVATHFAAAFKNAGHTIKQVWSLNAENAALLAYHVKAEAISDLNYLDTDCDLLIISVKDDAIPELASCLKLNSQPVLHTSGSTGIEVLNGVSENIGVLYPVQTFSKHTSVDMYQVPLAVEANSEELSKVIEQLAGTISGKVFRMNSPQRLALHVAAVFACNFSNHLYTIAKQITDRNQLDFELLRPLIAESARKIMSNAPEQVQTGPAIRNDYLTMDKHLNFLRDDAEIQDLYRELSQIIINFYSNRQG